MEELIGQSQIFNISIRDKIKNQRQQFGWEVGRRHHFESLCLRHEEPELFYLSLDPSMIAIPVPVRVIGKNLAIPFVWMHACLLACLLSYDLASIDLR
jgi:hypothetical protein